MSECKMSLLVRNLRYETSPERVRRHFEQFGDVRDVYLPLHYHTKKPRGFGFVEFFDEGEARNCLKNLHRSMLDGNEISVTIAQQGRKSPDTMRHRDRRQDYDDNSGGRSGGGRRYSSRSRSPGGGGHHNRRRGSSRSRGHRSDDRVSNRHDDDRWSRDRQGHRSYERSASRSVDRHGSSGYRRRDSRRYDRRRRDSSRSHSDGRRHSGGRDEYRSQRSAGKGGERSRRSPPARRNSDTRNEDYNEDADVNDQQNTHSVGVYNRGANSDRSRSCSPDEGRQNYDSGTGSPRRVIEESSDTGPGNYDGRRSCSGDRGAGAPSSRSRSPVRQVREECDYGQDNAMGDDQQQSAAGDNKFSVSGGAITSTEVVGGLDEESSICNGVENIAEKRSRSGSPEA